MGHDDWNWMDVRKLANALGWAPREIEDLVNRGLVPGQREGNRTLVSVSDFVRYVSARNAYGQQARANLEARAQQTPPDTPLILDGFVIDSSGSTRGNAHRGAKSASSNIIETVDPTTGRRTISRRDFFTGE